MKAKNSFVCACLAFICAVRPPSVSAKSAKQTDFSSIVAAPFRRVVATPPEKRAYHSLLSLDGGALRLYMTTQILKEIEDEIRSYYFARPDLLPEPVENIDDVVVYLADFFDLIAGVSAGSWVSLYLSSKGGNGVSDQVFAKPEIRAKYGDIYAGSAYGLDVFFDHYGAVIYPPSNCGVFDLRPVCQRVPRPCRSTVWPPILGPGRPGIRGLTSALFCSEGLELTLAEFLGDTQLSELSASSLVIAFDLAIRETILFTLSEAGGCRVPAFAVIAARSNSVSGRTRGKQATGGEETTTTDAPFVPDSVPFSGQDFLIREIARISSAFPGLQDGKGIEPTSCAMPPDRKAECAIFFPCEEPLIPTTSCVDGSVAGNNPTPVATNFLSQLFYRASFSSIATISLGSGSATADMSDLATAGNLQWTLSGSLLGILLDASSEFVQSNLDFLYYGQLKVPPGQYLRIQVFADADTRWGRALLDTTDASKAHMNLLKEIGQEAAGRYAASIQSFIPNFLLKEAPTSDDPKVDTYPDKGVQPQR